MAREIPSDVNINALSYGDLARRPGIRIVVWKSEIFDFFGTFINKAVYYSYIILPLKIFQP